MSTPPTGTQGLGRAFSGISPWGSGVVPGQPGPPVITPLSPVDGEKYVSQSAPIYIRVTDDLAANPATLWISVGPVIYVLGGAAQNGATLALVANGGNGFDIELILPDRYPLNSRQEVVVHVSDYSGDQAELTYHFDVGIALRMLSVRNPSPNILVAYYNRSLRQDAALRFVSNWNVEAISPGAKELRFEEVMTNVNHPDIVTFRYSGGGSVYRLSNPMVLDKDGNLIDPAFSSALFDIFYGDDPAPSITLFDTIYGPIGVSQQSRRRRTIDQHVVNRSIALGMDEQFRHRMRNLDGSAGRTNRPGAGRNR